MQFRRWNFGLPSLAAATMTALAAGPSLAHDIEAIHVHESHIAQGLVLAMLAAVACGAGLVFAVLWRRAKR